MHLEAYNGFAERLAASGLDTQHEWLGLDVGGADVNGSVRDQLPNTVWHGLDIGEAPGVDFVDNAATWAGERFYDLVIATELFEHTSEWREIIANMAAHLDPDGPQVFISTCASTGRHPHGARGEWGVPPGQFYANVNPSELQEELEKHFQHVVVVFNPNPGDAYALAIGLK